MAKTVRNLINENQDDDTAITSDNNQIITFKALKKQVHDISGQLAGHGINKNDRAVIVLPNGPEMATAFLAISSYMSAAPLNPSYKLSEYEFYLKDLKPKIVIVEKESTNAVVEAANKLNIEICEIKQIKEKPKGIFNLYDSFSDFEVSDEEDEALVLHTSGTTSRPKVVPLTNKNIFSSAYNISSSLRLAHNDHGYQSQPVIPLPGFSA